MMYRGFQLEIDSAEEPARFARRLGALVNGSPVALTRVVVAGTVVYPVPAGPVDPTTVRVCTFGARHGRIDDRTLGEVLARLAGEVRWSWLRPLPITDPAEALVPAA